VCTPGELAGWPPGGWLLLDCADQERRRRLAGSASADDAVDDAAAYRALGLPAIDTTNRIPQQVAEDIAWFVRRLERLF
jgi:hypothetical protein